MGQDAELFYAKSREIGWSAQFTLKTGIGGGKIVRG